MLRFRFKVPEVWMAGEQHCCYLNLSPKAENAWIRQGEEGGRKERFKTDFGRVQNNFCWGCVAPIGDFLILFAFLL